MRARRRQVACGREHGFSARWAGTLTSFFAATSRITSISRSRFPPSFLGRTFSASSCRSRRKSPVHCFHRPGSQSLTFAVARPSGGRSRVRVHSPCRNTTQPKIASSTARRPAARASSSNQETCVRPSPNGRTSGRSPRARQAHQPASIASGTSPEPNPDRFSGPCRLHDRPPGDVQLSTFACALKRLPRMLISVAGQGLRSHQSQQPLTLLPPSRRNARTGCAAARPDLSTPHAIIVLHGRG